MIKILLSIMCFILFFLFPASVAGEEPLKEDYGNLREAEEKNSELKEKVAILDDELEHLKEKISELKEQDDEGGSLGEKKEKVKEIEEKIRDYEEEIENRIRIMHEQSLLDYMGIYFSSNSFVDFLTRAYSFSLLSIDEDKKEEEVEDKSTEEILRERSQVLTAFWGDIDNTERNIEAKKESLRIIRDSVEEIEHERNRGLGSDPLWPVEGSSYVTSPFGMRIHPIEKVRSFHAGIDIGTHGRHSPVVAVAGGKVVHAGHEGGYGKTVVIDHGDGKRTLYAHLSSISCSWGQEVERGDRIGRVGNTGSSLGVHLHFEVWKYGNQRDPLEYVSISGGG